MEILRLDTGNIEECAVRAATVLSAGGVVLYPTDTLYGLGADAFSDDAVDKIYSIKTRDEKKPTHALVADLAMAARYGEIPDNAKKLFEKFGGKVTLVVLKKNAGTGIVRGNATFGFRIPDHPFCKAMLAAFGKPITATSANVSGASQPRRIEEILAQLGPAAESIGLAVDAGELPERKASTVVDVTGPEVKIIREAAISASEIEAALRG